MALPLERLQSSGTIGQLDRPGQTYDSSDEHARGAASRSPKPRRVSDWSLLGIDCARRGFGRRRSRKPWTLDCYRLPLDRNVITTHPGRCQRTNILMIEPRAALGYCHPGDVRNTFFMSIIGAFAYEAGTHGVPFLIIGEACPSGDLPESRNRVTAHFLDNTDAEWLWWVDADMGFEPDTLSRLLDAADPVARPVVGALCFGLRKAGDDPALQAYTFECFPTLYAWEEHGDHVGFRVVPDYPDELW